MAEDDLKNKITLAIGYSIDIYSNSQLFTYIKRSNQVLHIYTNLGSKINQMQLVVPDYSKVWYDDKAIANIFSPTNLVNKYIVTYDSHQDDTFTVNNNRGIIKSRKIKRDIYLQAHIYYRKFQCFHHSGIKYGGIHKQTNREGQVSQKNIQQCRDAKCVEI